jgi:hypothetical protein
MPQLSFWIGLSLDPSGGMDWQIGFRQSVANRVHDITA